MDGSMKTYRNELWADGQLQAYTIVVDHGDGTGVRTLYDGEDNMLETEPVTDLPVPEDGALS